MRVGGQRHALDPGTPQPGRDEPDLACVSRTPADDAEPISRPLHQGRGSTLSTWSDSANLRHLATETSLQPGFWVSLLLGAIVTIVFSFLFVMDNFIIQALMTGMMTGLMALLLFLVAVLDKLLTGLLQVSKGAYAHAIEMFNAQNLGPAVWAGRHARRDAADRRIASAGRIAASGDLRRQRTETP